MSSSVHNNFNENHRFIRNFLGAALRCCTRGIGRSTAVAFTTAWLPECRLLPRVFPFGSRLGQIICNAELTTEPRRRRLDDFCPALQQLAR